MFRIFLRGTEPRFQRARGSVCGFFFAPEGAEHSAAALRGVLGAAQRLGAAPRAGGPLLGGCQALGHRPRRRVAGPWVGGWGGWGWGWLGVVGFGGGGGVWGWWRRGEGCGGLELIRTMECPGGRWRGLQGCRKECSKTGGLPVHDYKTLIQSTVANLRLTRAGHLSRRHVRECAAQAWRTGATEGGCG